MERALGSWQDLLPDVYKWIEGVSIDAAADLQKADLWIIPVDKNDEKVELPASIPSGDIKSKLSQALTSSAWKGDNGSHAVMIDGSSYLFVTVPKVDTRANQKARQIGLNSWNYAKSYQIKEVGFLGTNDLNSLDIMEGFAIGAIDTGSFKGTRKSRDLIGKIKLCGPKQPSAEQVAKTRHIVKSTAVTKVLQDAPPNWADPEALLEVAKYIKSINSKIDLAVLNKEEIAAKGLGSFMSVARGSDNDCKLICLRIPGKDSSKTISLIGKGVTFDSGGINIKPSQGMAEMKYDMSGAAAVLGSALFFAENTPPTDLVCAIGAVENLPSGKATKPSDVVKAFNGKTVEILNTDAEGRLVLADVISYVTKTYNPEFIIDIATLTGAVLYGLGHAGAGFMTHNEDAAKFVQAQAEAVGEPVWRLPLWPELAKETKSDIADLKNIAKSDVLAGTIMGGWFLREFIEDSVKGWVHLDIAGTGWSCSATGFPSGGSAFGVRTMVESVLNFPHWNQR
jgi:leucyl aminopeptidase